MYCVSRNQKNRAIFRLIYININININNNNKQTKKKLLLLFIVKINLIVTKRIRNQRIAVICERVYLNKGNKLFAHANVSRGDILLLLENGTWNIPRTTHIVFSSPVSHFVSLTHHTMAVEGYQYNTRQPVNKFCRVSLVERTLVVGRA